MNESEQQRFFRESNQRREAETKTARVLAGCCCGLPLFALALWLIVFVAALLFYPPH